MNITTAEYVTDYLEGKCGIKLTIDGKILIVPLDPNNRHYEEIVQATAYDNSIWGELVPEPMASISAEWMFNKQLREYVDAIERLSQYILSEGRPELTEDITISTEEVWNEETEEYDTVATTETVITQTSIGPLEPTIEVTTTDPETLEPTTETIPNPLIVSDNAERAVAQAIVDATPQSVIDSLS